MLAGYLQVCAAPTAKKNSQEPYYSETCIKRTVAEVPKFPLFTLNETFIKRTPLLSGRGHLKVPEMVISIVANLY